MGFKTFTTTNIQIKLDEQLWDFAAQAPNSQIDRRRQFLTHFFAVPQHQQYLNDGNFDELYAAFSTWRDDELLLSYTPTLLTDTLVIAGVDPLEHLSAIPEAFLQFTHVTQLKIPPHITRIASTSALSQSFINNLYIHNKYIKGLFSVFVGIYSGSGVHHIVFDGTMDEFIKLYASELFAYLPTTSNPYIEFKDVSMHLNDIPYLK